MDELTVVVTCAASLVLPSTVTAIKGTSARACRFVGVDAADEPLASCYLDDFAQVPWASDPDYVGALLKVVQEARAQALLVLSDAEAVVLSEPVARQRFQEVGCMVLLPDHSVVRTCVDKGLFMGFLQQHPSTAQTFHLVNEAHELPACAASFGYPDEPFVLKPRNGCGSRGVMVVDATASPFDLLFERNYRRHTLESLQITLSGHHKLDLLAMPLYGGRDYNIDVMCQGGKVAYSLAQERISPRMGAIMTAKVVDEHDINVLLAALAQRLNVTGLVNVEVARCHRTGQPRVYEINPRPSAAFAFLCYQGVDVMSDLLVSFQGGALRPRRFQPMLVKRVWSQLHDA